MPTRDYLYGDAYRYDYWRALENYYSSIRERCTVEVHTSKDGTTSRSLYAAYEDSVKLDGVKLTFTTVLGNQETTIYLDSVTKVTINKESK